MNSPSNLRDAKGPPTSFPAALRDDGQCLYLFDSILPGGRRPASFLAAATVGYPRKVGKAQHHSSHNLSTMFNTRVHQASATSISGCAARKMERERSTGISPSWERESGVPATVVSVCPTCRLSDSPRQQHNLQRAQWGG